MPHPDPAPAGLRFRGVSHWFAAGAVPRVVLRDIDLAVPENQFVAIVGASGCGKTTLLNLAAGLIQPQRGTLEIGIAGRGIAPPSPDIGYMWARDTLFPWRSLQQNVAFGLELRGMDRAARHARAAWALDLVGLTAHAQQLPKALSHGMRQRGNLARLLALDPALYLFDEPFSALDAQTKAKLQKELAGIWQARPRTVLYVTHDLGEAALLADRIVMMSRGVIQHDITVPFARPRDLDELRFDAGFQGLARELWRKLGALEGQAA